MKELRHLDPQKAAEWAEIIRNLRRLRQLKNDVEMMVVFTHHD